MSSCSFCFMDVCSVDTLARSWWMLQGEEQLKTLETQEVQRYSRRLSFSSSLDVLLVSRALHRLRSPSLLLLRHVVLERDHSLRH